MKNDFKFKPEYSKTIKNFRGQLILLGKLDWLQLLRLFFVTTVEDIPVRGFTTMAESTDHEPLIEVFEFEPVSKKWFFEQIGLNKMITPKHYYESDSNNIHIVIEKYNESIKTLLSKQYAEHPQILRLIDTVYQTVNKEV